MTVHLSIVIFAPLAPPTNTPCTTALSIAPRPSRPNAAAGRTKTTS